MSNATRDYGDLRVTMTSDWEWRYNDRGSGATRNIDVYHAKPQGDMRPLGSFAASSYIDGLSGKRATLLVGKNPNTKGSSIPVIGSLLPKPGDLLPAVASPTGYEQMWTDKASGGDHDGSFWRPNAPLGYVSLGDVCTGNWNAPSLNDVWCVRADLVLDTDFEPASLWDDRKSGATLNCSVWALSRPLISVSGGEKLSVINDTFRIGPKTKYAVPSSSLAKVLALPCPKEYVEFDSKLPVFTKNNLPKGGDTFAEKSQAEVVLPYTAFFPSSDKACLGKISNPFVSLSKRAAWFVYSTHTNNSGGTISDSMTITKGVTREQSSEMSHSAGVEVSASYGIGAFSGSVSLNYQFTSTRSSSYSETKETSRVQGFTVPPYQATVFLVKHVWITARRCEEGSELYELGFHSNEDISLVGVDLK